MLTGLSVRNVVLIEALDLDLKPGLTALTGETGAGKSIILDALGMALGARSDKGLVRSGADKAACTAAFDITVDHPARAILEDADMAPEEGEPLVLRRTLTKDGRSRAFINDAPVSAKLLASVGRSLLEVHGQHDGRGLLDPSEHIRMLDNFAGLDTETARVRAAWQALHQATVERDRLRVVAEKADADRDFLTHAIEELDRLDPRAGEEESLSDERRFLQGAEGALAELTAAQDAMGEQNAFENRLSTALTGIERVRAKVGVSQPEAAQALDAASAALERAMLETQEARACVAEAAGRFDIHPGKLDTVEQRLFALRAAARKFGVSVEALTEQRRTFAGELETIGNVDRDLKTAEKVVEQARQTYDRAAKDLSEKRRAAGTALDTAVAAELPPLKMERARFETGFAETAAGPTGTDKVTFTVSTNPGTPTGPLNKIASGGEMSRFALAIKAALAGRQHRVMVFDEVDQGVGGAVADAVGRRLSGLSRSAQVFVVTHSPQVAAMADHQYRIRKISSDDTTITRVSEVRAEDREEEIARMLAGESITDEARAAARQLMKAS